MIASGGNAGLLSTVLEALLNTGLSALIAWLTARSVTTKSNFRSAFDEILSLLDEVQSEATELLLIGGEEPSCHRLFRKVGLADERLGRRLTELFRRKRVPGTTSEQPVPNGINRARISLRHLVTDQSLIDKERAACPGDDRAFVELGSRCDRLRTEIRGYADQFGVGDLQ